MKILTQISCAFLAISAVCTTHANPSGTEFDQYLIGKNILDSQFKIKNKTALNEILLAMSEEDSRTLPYQVDQNMRLEKMLSTSEKMSLEGSITTPDFAQFEKDVGLKKVHELIKSNSLQQCKTLFEHQFQRVNPYHIELNLLSSTQNYQISINNNECKFN